MQSLENLITVDEAAASLSHVAEVVVEVLLADVLAGLEAQHGRPAGGCAVVAMGKLGAGEMTFESDLDLLLVADLPDDRETTAGPPHRGGALLRRAARRLIAALGSRSPSGPLYEVDMRLRPSGGERPPGDHPGRLPGVPRRRRLDLGADVPDEGRVLCGDEAAAGAAAREIRQVLTRPRDPAALLRDVTGMRDRIAAEYPPGDPSS